jgi:hypothetical protein
MFEWPWIGKIVVDERVANKAVEIARDLDLKPADSIHAASAFLKKVEAIQRWDRDYEKVRKLVPSEEPVRMSSQADLLHDYRALGPHPDDFETKVQNAKEIAQGAQNTPQLRADNSSSAGNPSRGKEAKAD